jgi:tetratricopeptide (TPR) repeat protein
MAKRLTIIALTMSVSTVSAGPLAPQSVSAAGRARLWVEAVQNHRPGELDDAVRVIAPWPRADAIAAADAAAGSLGRDHAAANRLLTRAALLHADIAMLHRGPSGYDLPSNGRTVKEVYDGQLIGALTGTVHWDVGRTLLNDVQPKPAADDRVRLWYRATSAFFLHWREFTELEPNLELGLELVPADGTLLLFAGTMHESYAAPRIQNAAEQLNLGPRTPPPFGSVGNELKEGEKCFREALAADPGLIEARIRLGHVLGLRERHSEAIGELQLALAAPLPAALRYYALIFVGREHLILGQRDAARQEFELAAILFPGAQSPRLGLSVLSRDAGSSSAALAALQLLVIPPTIILREDPLWLYERTHVPDMNELVAQLRRRLSQ